MAQYREGAVNLFFGETAVSGTGTRWLANVTTGDMLLIGSNGPAAFVASVISDTELLLEQGWPGPDAAGAVYAIHRDFDPTTGAPLMAPGDTALHIIFNRAINRLSVQTGAAIAGSEAVQQAAAARAGAEGAAATAVTASEAADDAKAAAQTAAQAASADAASASAAAATAAADATSASDDAAAASVSAITAGTAAADAVAAKDTSVASSATAMAAAASAGTSAAAAATSAGQAQDAAATATQAASDTDGARDAAVAAATATAQEATAAAAASVTAGNAKDDAVTAASAAQSDAADALAARDLAQAWAVSPENTPVPQYPGLYSALHWAKKAADSAAEAAGIVTGNNFGVIGDGGSAQFNAGGPGATLNFVAGTGVQLGFDAGTRAVSIGTTDTDVTPGSFGSATQVGTYTVDAQGRLTAAGNTTITPAWSAITSKPTTLSGYGITDAMPATGRTLGTGESFTITSDNGAVLSWVQNTLNLRKDGASMAGVTSFQNFGITASSQGVTIATMFGSGGTFGGAAAQIQFQSTDTWVDPANKSAQIKFRYRHADALYEGLTIGRAGLVTPLDVKAPNFMIDAQEAEVGVGTVILGAGNPGTLTFSDVQNLSPGDTVVLPTNSYPIYTGSGTSYTITPAIASTGTATTFTIYRKKMNVSAASVHTNPLFGVFTRQRSPRLYIGSPSPVLGLNDTATSGISITNDGDSSPSLGNTFIMSAFTSLASTSNSIFVQRGRGAIASPEAVQAGDALFTLAVGGYGLGSDSLMRRLTVGSLNFSADTAPLGGVNTLPARVQLFATDGVGTNVTRMAFAGGEWKFTSGKTTANADASFVVNTGGTDRLTVRGDGTLTMAANAVKIFSRSGHLVTRPYTVTTLPTATDTGEVIYVTDATGGAVPAYWNGTAWVRVSDLSDVSGDPAPSGGGGGGGLELVHVYTIPDATTVTEVVFDQFGTTPGVYIIEFEGVAGSGNLGLAMQYKDAGSTTWVTEYTYESTNRIMFSIEPLIVSTGSSSDFIKLNPDDPYDGPEGNAAFGRIEFLANSEAQKHAHFPATWEMVHGLESNSKGFGGSGGVNYWSNIGQVRLYNHRTPAVLSAGTFRLYRKQTSL